MATVLSVPGLHGRPVVNRRFPVSYRGRLVIVAGGLDYSVTADPLLRSTLADSGLDIEQLPTYAAIAVATLVDSHQSGGLPGCPASCVPWGSTSSSFFHLVLDDVRALARPIRGWSARPGMPEATAKEHDAVLAAR
jgi:hypothetical protein